MCTPCPLTSVRHRTQHAPAIDLTQWISARKRLKVDFVSHSRPTSARMAHARRPKGNRLLAALTDADWQRWRPRLECVDLTRGQVLYEPGRPRRHAYFPTSAVVSLLCTVASGASTEIAVVGNEGVVGISLLLGADSTTNGSAVLIAGRGFRIAAQAIQDEFDRSDAVRRVLLRYIQALATQIAQTVICNRHHSIEQQLCGLLLHSLDRLQGSEVVVTQELIASRLGVRRESVTAAASQLQAAGLIHYCARPCRRARPCGTRATILRVPRRGQEGVRPPVAAGTRRTTGRPGPVDVAGLAGSRLGPPHAAARGRGHERSLKGRLSRPVRVPARRRSTARRCSDAVAPSPALRPRRPAPARSADAT